MTTTLLSPACDPCYDCCQQCEDYYDPNQWYAWSDKFASSGSGVVDTVILVGPGTSPAQYYWSASDLHTTLNDLLAAVAWELPLDVLTEKNYKATVEEISISGASASGTINFRPVQDPPSAWYPVSIAFTNFRFRILEIYSRCTGDRYARGDIRFDVSQVAGPYETLPGTTQDKPFSLTTNSGLALSINRQLCSVLPLLGRSTDSMAGYGNPFLAQASTGSGDALYGFDPPLALYGTSPFPTHYKGQIYLGTTPPT